MLARRVNARDQSTRRPAHGPRASFGSDAGDRFDGRTADASAWRAATMFTRIAPRAPRTPLASTITPGLVKGSAHNLTSSFSATLQRTMKSLRTADF
jgi:hypothetical protein